jgi:hypothetical protein
MELRSGAMPDQPRPAVPTDPDQPRPAAPTDPDQPRPAVAAGDGPGVDADPQVEVGRPGDSAVPAAAGPAADGPWRADVRLTLAALLGCVLFGLAAAFVSDPVGRALLAIAAVICALYAVRGIVAPVRLSADEHGLTVIRGYLGRARLAWSEVDGITVQRRSRLGMRSTFLEIDAGDQLYLLSEYDLGVEPDAVLGSLRRLRTGH